MFRMKNEQASIKQSNNRQSAQPNKATNGIIAKWKPKLSRPFTNHTNLPVNARELYFYQNGIDGEGGGASSDKTEEGTDPFLPTYPNRYEQE